MARARIPGFRTVSKKEACELSKLPWVRDEALSSRMTEVRVLPDGRLLLFTPGDKGVIYPTRESLEQVMREGKEARRAYDERTARGEDSSTQLLPPLDDFLRDVEAHASRLGAVLGVPAEALDRRPGSLDVVHKAVMRKRRAQRMAPEVVVPLTAYIGEVMRFICDGSWTKPPKTMRQRVGVYYAAENRYAEEWHDDPLTGHANEPMIRAPDGNLFQPFAVVVVELEKHEGRRSLRAATTIALAHYMAVKGLPL